MEEISYKSYFKAQDMPDGSVVLPNFMTLEVTGPRYYEPVIEAVVQCVGSKASGQTIDETFRMEEILVDETISNIELDFEKLIDKN